MVAGVEYDRIDAAGLQLRIEGEPQLLEVDTIIVCAGQLPARGLHDELVTKGAHPVLIGGAYEAAELDAKQAIKQATELALVA